MIVFFGNTLNRHQSNVADVLYELTEGDYIYVETVAPTAANKSGGKARVERPYVLEAFKGEAEYKEALRLAQDADVALFGADSLAFEVVRMRQDTPKLAFEVSERWLKRGWINLLSPRLLKNQWYYHAHGWGRKPIYKLCSSAYGADDQYKLHSFKGRCYKWGYFTKVDEGYKVKALNQSVSTSETIPLMWCARFLRWKHPELPVQLAQRLKEKGYKFHIDMFGTGEELESTKALIKALGVENYISLKGNLPNDKILEEMRNHSIFLFTSDRNEGWGAVLNESMSNGCAVVVSNAIGSVPFLVKDGENGLIFKSDNIDSLYEKTVILLTNPEKRILMSKKAYKTISEIWSPRKAAENLLQLIDDFRKGRACTIKDGPCSKAFPLCNLNKSK